MISPPFLCWGLSLLLSAFSFFVFFPLSPPLPPPFSYGRPSRPHQLEVSSILYLNSSASLGEFRQLQLFCRCRGLVVLVVVLSALFTSSYALAAAELFTVPLLLFLSSLLFFLPSSSPSSLASFSTFSFLFFGVFSSLQPCFSSLSLFLASGHLVALSLTSPLGRVPVTDDGSSSPLTLASTAVSCAVLSLLT